MHLITRPYTIKRMTNEIDYGIEFLSEATGLRQFRLQIGTVFESVGLDAALAIVQGRTKEYQWAVDALIAAAKEQS